MTLTSTPNFLEYLRDLVSDDLGNRYDYGLVKQWAIYEGINQDAGITQVQILDKAGVAAYEIEVRRIGGTNE